MIEIGQQYGVYTVIGGTKTLNKKMCIACKCSCGKTRNIAIERLEKGKKLVCNCEILEKMHSRNRIWGISKGKFHYKRKGMRDRCRKEYSPGFSDYGGRGIICEWENFKHFYDEMYESYLENVKIHGERDTTIERIDCNGPYSKSNCRWASRKEQTWNKRDTLWIEYNGENKSLGQRAYEMGFNYGAVKNHIVRKGMTLEQAILIVERNKKIREECSCHSEFIKKMNEINKIQHENNSSRRK